MARNQIIEGGMAKTFEFYVADFNDKPIVRVAEYATVDELAAHNFQCQQVICIGGVFYPWSGYERWIAQHGPSGVPSQTILHLKKPSTRRRQ
jgi:hypothetical protein